MQLTEDQIKRLARRHVSSKGIGETIVVGGSSNDRSSGYADIAKRAYEADHAKSAATLDDGSTTLQKIDEKYLSKEHDDTAEGIIDFLKGIKIGGRPLSELFLSKEHDDTAEGVIDFLQGIKVGGRPLSELFLSKEHDDEAGGKITFRKGIRIGADGSYEITEDGIAKLAGVVADYLRSSDFAKGTAAGLDGTGYGLMKDGNGKYTLEIDNIIVRLKMIIANLEVHEMTYIGGTIVMSPCGGRIDIVEAYSASGGVPAVGQTAYYRCYFLSSDSDGRAVTNKWAVGQLARCKTYDYASGSKVTNKDYWRLVVGVSAAPVTINGKSYHYIDLSNKTGIVTLTASDGQTYGIEGVWANSNGVPEAGDHVVGMGHLWDAGRQDVAITSASGWVLYKGINSYDLADSKIVNQFDIVRSIITTDHLTIRPYADTSDAQTLPCMRGTWDASKAYGHNDLVTFDGQLWLCTVAVPNTVKGEKPTLSSTKWALYVERGYF